RGPQGRRPVIIAADHGAHWKSALEEQAGDSSADRPQLTGCPSDKDRSIVSHSTSLPSTSHFCVNDPFQRTRQKIQVTFCFGIRCTAHLSSVVDGIRTARFQSILNGHPRRCGSIQPSSKCGEPFAHRQWSIVRNQINPGTALLCCCNGGP